MDPESVFITFSLSIYRISNNIANVEMNKQDPIMAFCLCTVTIGSFINALWIISKPYEYILHCQKTKVRTVWHLSCNNAIIVNVEVYKVAK